MMAKATPAIPSIPAAIAPTKAPVDREDAEVEEEELEFTTPVLVRVLLTDFTLWVDVVTGVVVV